MSNAGYIIGGSHALRFSLTGGSRVPKDLDIFLPLNGLNHSPIHSKEKVEYHYFPESIFNQFQTNYDHLDLKSLYVLKLSHSEYNIHWNKTVSDICFMKDHLGISSYTDLDPGYIDLYKALRKHWKSVHKKNVSLNTDKGDFFSDKVKRKYDHDDLHLYVAYEDKPFYAKILKENQQVMIDKSKFDQLAHEDKLKVCREEITVIAIERFLIPEAEFKGYSGYYRSALKKVVTSMTTGWFPTFIVENYPKLIRPDDHCIAKIRNFHVDFEDFYSTLQK